VSEPALTIRRARREDVPAIVALYADDMLGAARETPDALDCYYDVFDRVDGELLVGEMDGVVVATMQLTMIQQLSAQGGKVAQIESVRVARALRSHGLGAILIRDAIERARAAGCARVQLTSNQSRKDAHRFYERLGFVASHTGFKLAL
jgi:ribosomal protein S18 acetylase RimI-like enzyme